jgi:predicted RNA methylase
MRRLAGQSRRSPLIDGFDQEHGTDTAGNRGIASLDVIELPEAQYAVHYEPSSAEVVRRALEKLSIDAAGFTFVDFGSGKGRVLLVAASFPFKEVIGVEFSRELHEIALSNIARLQPAVSRAGKVSSIHCEASAFTLPSGKLVCYFNNPFGPPVMARVVQRLVAHHRDHGCQIIVAYAVPRHRGIFEDAAIFEILDETSDIVILTTRRRAVSRAKARVTLPSRLFTSPYGGLGKLPTNNNECDQHGDKD